MRGLAILGSFVLALGCEGARTLTVDLRTDFVGGVEFTAVRTDVVAGPPGGPIFDTETVAAFADAEGWFTGRRVSEVSGLSGDDYSVQVTLLDAGGRTVASRVIRAQVRSSYALVVVITRDCAGVVCPGPGDPAEAITCFGGRCVDPRCGTPEGADLCPEDACASAGDCPPAAVPCVRPACVAGACLAEPTGSCATDEYCDVERGCTPRDEAPDAGAPGLDAAIEDAGAADAGAPDAGFDAGGGCVPGGACDPGDVCAIGELDCLDGSPVCVVAGPAPASTVCRPAAGDCDVEETCGGATTCPADALADGATACRASRGVCDAAELCTGASADCPADVDRPDGAACPAGVCIDGACVPCMPGLGCDLGPCSRGVIACPGGTPTCGGPATPATAGTACRDAAGPCDLAEQCDGSSTSCPPDRFRGASTVCRPMSGECDLPDLCDGSSAACPLDRVAGPGAECRPASGPCDAAETCSGVSTGCPGDVLQLPGTVCRGAVGPCDVNETCSGVDTTCPGDARRPLGFECRAAMGVCDVPEACDGSSTSCPADGFEPATTTCRPAGDVCNPAESCPGDGPDCPADATVANGTACGMEACGPFDTCTGSGCDLMMGMQSSSCTTPACASGSCSGATMRTQMQSCTRSASCPDACCNGAELGDTCAADCGPAPIGITGGASEYTMSAGVSLGAIAFDDLCPGDSVAWDLTVDQLGDHIEGMWTHCRDPRYVASRPGMGDPFWTVEPGTHRTLPMRGGNGWGTYDCPPGQVLTGFSAALTTFMTRQVIDAIELHCSRIAVIGREMPGLRFELTPGDDVMIQSVPITPAAPWFGPYDCPAGQVVRGFRGGYTPGSPPGTPDSLDRLAFFCQEITPR